MTVVTWPTSNATVTFQISQRALVGLSISRDHDCVEVRDIAQSRLDEVRIKLGELKALETSLAGFVTQCDAVCAGGVGRDCVVFRDLASPSRNSGCC